MPMTSLTLMLALAAAPKTFVWKLEDTRRVTSQNAPRELDFQVIPHLDATDLQITLWADGPPTKARVTVLKGPGRLKGQRFMLENNYGKAMLSEALAGEAPRDLPALEAAVATLFEDDPIITASKSGAACDEATTTAIARAAGQLVSRITMPHPEELEVTDAHASCARAKNSYAVSFTLAGSLRDEHFDIPFTGTVVVPPGAWRASFAVVGKVALRLQRESKKPVRIDGTLTIKSAIVGK